jgi:hypothetical protein
MKLIQVTTIVRKPKSTPIRRERRDARQRGAKLVLWAVTGLLFGSNVFGQLSSPGNLAASTVSSNRVTLNWVDSNRTSGEKNVLVSRALQSSPATFNNLATLSAGVQTFSDTTVAPSTSYIFKIAINPKSGGQSAVSSILNVTTPAAITSYTISPTTTNPV